MRRPTLRQALRSAFRPEGRRRPRKLPRALAQWRRLPLIALLFLVMVGVTGWWAAAHLEILSLRKVRYLEAITLALNPGETVVLGRKDLGQRAGPDAAEAVHLNIEARGNGLYLRNVAQTKRVVLSFANGEDAAAESFEFKPGESWRIGVQGAEIDVDEVSNSGLTLLVRSGGKQRRLRFGSSSSAAISEPWITTIACTDVNWRDQARAWTASLAKAWPWQGKRVRTIAFLGGKRDCDEGVVRQIGNLGDLPWRSLRLTESAGVFALVASEVARHNGLSIRFTPLDQATRARQREILGFSRIEWRIDGAPENERGALTSLVAGRTKYDVSITPRQLGGVGWTLTLTPTRTVAIFADSECGPAAPRPGDRSRQDCPKPYDVYPNEGTQRLASGGTIAWQWSDPARNILDPAAEHSVADLTPRASRLDRAMRIAVPALAVLAAVLLSWRERRRPLVVLQSSAVRWTTFSALLALAPEIASLFGVRLATPTAEQLILANWLLAGLTLLRGPSAIALGLLWVAVSVLAAIGSTTLAMLAVEAETTRFVSFFLKHEFVFLGVIPPAVVALASAPARSFRPVLRELVVEMDHGGIGKAFGWWFVRYGPHVGIVLAFVLWFAVGTQVGFDAFQPVEAGKFAAIMIIAAAVLRFDPDARLLPNSIGIGRWFSLLLVCGYVAILLLVPALRSDWSPALIMFAVGGLLAAIALSLRRAANHIDALTRRAARLRIPRAFRPRPRIPFWLSPALDVAGLIVILLIALSLGSDFAMRQLLALDHWPKDPIEQLQQLENKSLGGSRRVVAERFISWVDLSYDRPRLSDCAFPGRSPAPAAPTAGSPPPRACYSDIEIQLVRSRKVVAAAPCGIAGPLAVDKWLSRIAHSGWPTLEWLLARRNDLLRALPRFCDPRPPAQGSAALIESRRERDLADPVRIPVVQSDFVGAYLIGRFGVGGAILFYLAQVGFLLASCYAFTRVLSVTHSGNLYDRMVCNFLAVLIAGAALLVTAQWILSWSNVLGLLPVMGQPMTWLAYANSHHLFVALPCVLVLIIGLRYAGVTRPRVALRGSPPRRSFGRRWLA
jgi:hypothetical protein